MNKRLIFLLKYGLFWLMFFIVARIVFLIYNFNFTKHIPIKDILLTFIYGIQLDISITGYLLLLMLLIIFLLAFSGKTLNIIVTRIVTFFLIAIFSIITIVDVELYRNWGFRVDSTILLYLKSPKESLASTPIGLMLFLVLGTAIVIWIFIRFYKKHVEPSLTKIKPLKWYVAPLLILIAGSMIIPIRGGFGIAPINIGSVFFSQYQYANHAAVNCVWNFGESLTTMNKTHSIAFMEKEVAQHHFSDLYAVNAKEPFVSLIDIEKPNIIIIILESFSNQVIEPLGGLTNVTPNLNILANESVLFSNFYASGDRSDKGIVSILSGYPSQPTTSIIKYTSKSEKLPHLSRELKKLGYSTGFYYGGEIDFANMNSYFIGGGYEEMVTIDDFSGDDLNSKWGAHDHIVFQKLFNDLERIKQPFFRAMFTLSSHEPFDVPHTSEFNRPDDESKYLNAVHYTDSCLGDFIQKAKKTTWWNNTWIILVADHGSRLPGNVSYSEQKKFRIPMIWTGGAIKTDTVIDKSASQTDIPLMIGNQLKQNFENFMFSKDVLNHQKAFAFYAFNDGFGYFNDSVGFVWDNTSNEMILDYLSTDALQLEGKVFMQILSDDFNSK